MDGDEGLARDAPLFETKVARGRTAYRVFIASVLVGFSSIWVYRVAHFPSGGEPGKRWIWMGMLGAEIWFGLYWIITQSVRWSPVYRSTFKERLSQRYEADLPTVDVFICTASPTVEPPTMVVSTVLSVMAYDYPTHKLAVYLSDDGGSDLTFYALLQASTFAKHWIKFCKRYEVEPRSPAAYFSSSHSPPDAVAAGEWLETKRLYEKMTDRIEAVAKLGRVPEEMRQEHRGFAEWDSVVTPRDHHAIVQILIDGRREGAASDNGNGGVVLPTLVYLSREKRPQHHHNFKAGAMNTLIRVSSAISNGSIILNVDCDVYSNDSSTVRQALCFFMDERRGGEIGFVQYPQMFQNINKKDLYGNALNVTMRVDLPGMDSFGGSMYMGTGCFHRREVLCGKKYVAGGDHQKGFNGDALMRPEGGNLTTMEEKAKALATCTFEKNTQWGKEVGLKYGCLTEDAITGLAIQCRGWRSVYMYPDRPAFLGLSPITLMDTLVQSRRWSEGLFRIFLSKYCPFLYGRGKINLGLQMSYSIYCLWAVSSVPTLFYLTVPSLCLLQGVSLFPKTETTWFIPYAYLIIARHLYDLFESLLCGDTLAGWWSFQRMRLLRTITSCLFGLMDVLWNDLGLSESSTFVVTPKVAGADDGEVSRRHRGEVMELGPPLPAFTVVIAAVALTNLLCLAGGLMVAMVSGVGEFLLQILLCAVVVALNVPVTALLFLGKDNKSR